MHDYAGLDEKSFGVIADFAVYVAETNFTSIAGLTPVGTTRGHSADFPGLTPGQAYYFAVTTKNIVGCESLELPLRVVRFTPTELQVGGNPNGVFSVVVTGPRGAEYVLEGSGDLHNWFPLQTNAPAAMPFAVTVTNVPGVDRFYRVLIR